MTRSWPLAVVGAGPAGIAAATEAARLGATPLLFEQSAAVGGTIAIAHEVKNCPWAPRNAPGLAVAARLGELLGEWGIVPTRAEVVRIEPIDAELLVRTADGASHRAAAVVVATGTRALLPEIDGLPRRFGGPWFASARHAWTESRPSAAAVIGGGDVAFDQARALAAHGVRTAMLCRSEHPRAPRWLVERAVAEGITLRTGVGDLRGRADGSTLWLEWQPGADAHPGSIEVEALVAAIGRTPRLPELASAALASERLRIVGDATGRSARHVVVAMGDGCAAAHELLRARPREAASPGTAGGTLARRAMGLGPIAEAPGRVG
jgi:thioredoxin reductase (NADPH)